MMDEPFDDYEGDGSEEAGFDPGAGLVRVELGDDLPTRLDKALALAVPEEAALSRSRLSKLIDEGAVVRVGADGSRSAITDQKAKVKPGEIFEITIGTTEVLHTLPEDIPLEVVYEDDDLIVINKPAGMVVHPAPGTPSGTLVNALMHHCGDTLSGIGGERRPGIVHRIDKETSGLLVAAKSDRAHHGLAKQFEKHSVDRHYLAICYGVPEIHDPRLRGIKGVGFEHGGIIRVTTNLARHRTDRQKQAVTWPPEGRHAITRAHVVEAFGTEGKIGQGGQAALIDCWLETGRTHQIRVHLTHCGHGLIGDPVYGGKRRLSDKVLGGGAEAAAGFARQALHAATLGFDHPVSGERLEFSAPLPEDMVDLLDALRTAAPV